MSDGVSYEDYLDRYGTLTYTNTGASMRPLLREGRDLFIVRKKGAERCAVGDVVLFRRAPDKYVLHRVVEVRAEDYVTLGDNSVIKEYGVRDGDILGVMTGFVRGGREHSVTEAGYRVYAALWVRTAPLRAAAKKAVGKIRRGIKR